MSKLAKEIYLSKCKFLNNRHGQYIWGEDVNNKRIWTGGSLGGGCGGGGSYRYGKTKVY